MNVNYFETRFRSKEPTLTYPKMFAIISAYATTGQSWSLRENQNADLQLERELRERDIWLERITGFSPSSGHREPSWAVEIPFDDACEIGLRFKQDAVYIVQNDALFVSFCDANRRLVPVGPFRERVDVD